MKKNNCFVQRFIAACITSVAILAGCAGFTEDGNASAGDLVDDYAGQFASARVIASGSANIDEVNDSVTFLLDILGGCLKRNGSLVYDPNYYFVDEYRFAYKLRNDTLLLSYYYEDEISRELDTEIWVGENAGELDGTWLLTQCGFVDEKYGCVNDVYNKYFKIDGNKVEYRVDDRADFDYMNSVFVDDLFRFLKTSQNSVQVKWIFNGLRGGDHKLDDYGVVIQEKTNKNMKFTYDNRVFDLNLNYARYLDSVSVTLTSGETTCVGDYSIKRDVPPELCRDENAEYLQHTRSGSESEALEYEKSNYREFQDCIDGILGRERNN